MRKVLVIGNGAREHALCWKLAQEAEVFCCPGNPGIKGVAETFPIQAGDREGVLGLAFDIQPDLVLVGPEEPLINCLADALRAKNHLVFGPNADGAHLEGSKAWSKELMLAAGVPTAFSCTTSHLSEAEGFIRRLYEQGRDAVIKASGAAFGKGVHVASSREEALEAAKDFMVGRKHGSAGETVVIEERLTGREFSLMTLVNGHSLFSLPVAQDYKRVGDGDTGPNTGGMGSFAPAQWVGQDLITQTETQVVQPVIDELKKKGIDYRGVIFSGLMAENGAVKCIEYNVRFGDPETQSQMCVLGEGFLDALIATAQNSQIPAIKSNGLTAVSVVLAAHGYPDDVRKGDAIIINKLPENVVAFHAGTQMIDGQLQSSGGRVITLTARAATLNEARLRAYEATQAVQFQGCHFRTDVAAS